MMENISDDPTDANSAQFTKIELEVIAPLEQGFAKFDSLEADRARLESEVKRPATEEAAILNDENLAERDAVKRLLEVRARLSVQAARLGAADRRVQEQRFALQESCSVTRRRLSAVAYYLRTARVKRATAIFEDLIEGPIRFGSIGLMDLVRRVRFVRQIDQVINRIAGGQTVDPQSELDTLRQLARAWFEEVKSLVLTEPGFGLRDYSPKQVPAEIEDEPVQVMTLPRELVAV